MQYIDKIVKLGGGGGGGYYQHSNKIKLKSFDSDNNRIRNENAFEKIKGNICTKN